MRFCLCGRHPQYGGIQEKLGKFEKGQRGRRQQQSAGTGIKWWQMPEFWTNKPWCRIKYVSTVQAQFGDTCVVVSLYNTS